MSEKMAFTSGSSPRNWDRINLRNRSCESVTLSRWCAFAMTDSLTGRGAIEALIDEGLLYTTLDELVSDDSVLPLAYLELIRLSLFQHVHII